MKNLLAFMLAVVLISSTAYGQLYSNSFEYDDWNAAMADGWSYINVNQSAINFPTTTQHTGASPTDGQKVLEIGQPISGGIRKTIFDADVTEYVISFDWYVVNPNSSVSNGTGSKSYDSFFRMTKAGSASGIDFRVGHFMETREIEPGVDQPNARALVIRPINSNGSLGTADYTSYPAGGDVREARFFQDGWNTMEIHASAHPDLGGDWLRYYLNGAFVGESTVNWFGWSAAFSNIHFGWSSAANPGGTNTNIAYFDNFSVDELPEESSADFDGDGDVDGADFLTWQRGVGTGSGHSQGDADENGSIDGVDLGIWESQFGVQTTTAANPVPEPAALALAAVAAAWFVGRRRSPKRRRSSAA